MNKIETCWGKPFIRVSKKRFDNFIRFFEKEKVITGNYFMGWGDYYDWSLNPGFDPEAEGVTSEDRWHNLDKCMVARSYLETPHPEYYLSVDYIKDNNYDLDTVVPKERKKRLTKKEKAFAKALCDAFDRIFMMEALKEEDEEKNK